MQVTYLIELIKTLEKVLIYRLKDEISLGFTIVVWQQQISELKWLL